MLRMTRTDAGGTLQIKLEGALRGEWVDELQKVCQTDSRGRRIVLDLADVTYVDAAGRSLLSALLGRGIVFSACSGFVAELLHMGRP